MTLFKDETADNVLLRHLKSIRGMSPREYLGWLGGLIFCLGILLFEFVCAMLCLVLVLLLVFFISRVSGCNAIWTYFSCAMPFLGWFCYKKWVGLLVCAMAAAVFYVLYSDFLPKQEWMIWLYLFPLLVGFIGVWKFAQYLLYGVVAMGGGKGKSSASDFFRE